MGQATAALPLAPLRHTPRGGRTPRQPTGPADPAAARPPVASADRRRGRGRLPWRGSCAKPWGTVSGQTSHSCDLSPAPTTPGAGPSAAGQGFGPGSTLVGTPALRATSTADRWLASGHGAKKIRTIAATTARTASAAAPRSTRRRLTFDELAQRRGLVTCG